MAVKFAALIHGYTSGDLWAEAFVYIIASIFIQDNGMRIVH